METFATGKCLRRVPAFLNRQGRDSIHEIRFLISTEKVDDVVLLRIDEIMEEKEEFSSELNRDRTRISN
jgi:hypothetical protein